MSEAGDVVLSLHDLTKTFRKPFSGRRVEAVQGISLDVGRGEIVGFLGPNGAGKTTTIKMLTGLIAPTRGKMEIFGVAAPAPDVMTRVGFLSENPYIYPYLTPREFVTLCAQLSGLTGARLREAVVRVIERVGVAYAIDRAARTLSKGMLQRVALAAALVHDPELLILDEPMSGLDPVGRKEVRDLIVEEKKRGRTVFFSTHILSDVEMLCDRVCILRKGRIMVSGRIRDLLSGGKRHCEVTLAQVSDALRRDLAGLALRTSEVGTLFVMEIDGDAVRTVLERALASGASVESLTTKRETLEDLFVREAL
jgi:ABC-2 type transport system ATP-binding protein